MRKKLSINWRIATIFCVVIAILIGAGCYIRQKIVERKIKDLSVMVSAKFVESAELCVLKYEYRQDIAIKASLANIDFLPKSHAVVAYDGIIRIGLEDMRKIDFKITKGGKAITITIPPLKVLGNDVSNMRVISEGNSWFAPDVLHEDVSREIAKSQQATLDSLQTKTNFLDRAKIQVQTVLKEIVTNLNFKEITFKQW